jgi:tetratricopeptide (TPR) repeat protein
MAKFLFPLFKIHIMKIFFAVMLVLCVTSATAQIDSSLHYYTIAKQAFSERKYQLAEKNYLKSLSFNAANADAQNELGMAYIEMRKYHDAILLFKNVETRKPG